MQVFSPISSPLFVCNIQRIFTCLFQLCFLYLLLVQLNSRKLVLRIIVRVRVVELELVLSKGDLLIFYLCALAAIFRVIYCCQWSIWFGRTFAGLISNCFCLIQQIIKDLILFLNDASMPYLILYLYCCSFSMNWCEMIFIVVSLIFQESKHPVFQFF